MSSRSSRHRSTRSRSRSRSRESRHRGRHGERDDYRSSSQQDRGRDRDRDRGDHRDHRDRRDSREYRDHRDSRGHRDRRDSRDRDRDRDWDRERERDRDRRSSSSASYRSGSRDRSREASGRDHPRPMSPELPVSPTAPAAAPVGAATSPAHVQPTASAVPMIPLPAAAPLSTVPTVDPAEEERRRRRERIAAWKASQAMASATAPPASAPVPPHLSTNPESPDGTAIAAAMAAASAAAVAAAAAVPLVTPITVQPPRQPIASRPELLMQLSDFSLSGPEQPVTAVSAATPTTESTSAPSAATRRSVLWSDDEDDDMADGSAASEAAMELDGEGQEGSTRAADHAPVAPEGEGRSIAGRAAPSTGSIFSSSTSPSNPPSATLAADPALAADSVVDPPPSTATASGGASTAAATGGAPSGASSSATVTVTDVDDDIDPLDAFMMNLQQESEADRRTSQPTTSASGSGGAEPSSSTQSFGTGVDLGAGDAVVRDVSLFDDDSDPDSEKEEEEDDIMAKIQRDARRRILMPVDHDSIEYAPFRRSFYMEPQELTQMSKHEVDELMADMGGIKVHGRNVPRPVTKWIHCGLDISIMEVIKGLGFEAPTPIQAQAIPAAMSGRDAIAIAKTGSGKTLAYLLPMFRHIMDQPPLSGDDGPIGLVIIPTRELAVQIYQVCRRFCKVLGIRPVCAYGGVSVSEQIADLKRGASILIATPGRLIELLCANNGRVTNLRRVTYLVLDEADRLFDGGFEPQVMRVVRNTRPDRQTVVFSATFPRTMEALAVRILNDPVRIVVGGRAVVPPSVRQHIEVVPEDEKFLKLLEILGKYHDGTNRGIIFVERQQSVDRLFATLQSHRYSCLSLHGGKDQSDRDDTLSEFKAGRVPLLVSTSLAARGLDVRNLTLVINYDCPNHYEDYVHRCGRTGRAGTEGDAFTFITPEQDRFANDLVQALKRSGLEVPEPLQELYDSFMDKRRQGFAQIQGSGFSGKGLERIEVKRIEYHRTQRKAHGEGDDEELERDAVALGGPDSALGFDTDKATRRKPSTKELEARRANAEEILRKAGLTAAAPPVETAAPSPAGPVSLSTGGVRSSAELLQRKEPGTIGLAPFHQIIEINDYPQRARWRATKKENLREINEETGCAITTRGTFMDPSRPVPAAMAKEPKLHLLVEGHDEASVNQAVRQIKALLDDATLVAMQKNEFLPGMNMLLGGPSGSGRYLTR
ncbi:hypothetical protein H696_04600 [Fonticula alba]|uniref:RNA helicase n=1 Tax=Fonticula alba TaxID=691883 RepID=A0A058Z4J2_FONAL|nr:hypothetical protein H696_04600 [Fonticula alba]KCV69190.1 hypothetical protein H696_04600 [Fonticula alba]|eukprot:XP_009496761.1 hypothetical protein H696_04600 [Fonticula alba]